MTPIHPMIAFRRDVYESIVDQMVKNVATFRPKLLSYSEQLIYAYIASKAPWQFINVNAYTWYKRPGGNHSNATIDITNWVRNHIREVLA
jgi:hypothetical protein